MHNGRFMRISTSRIELTKRFALTISRGTITGSTAVIVWIEHDGVTGFGEMSPSDVTGDTADRCEAAIERLAPELAGTHPLDRAIVERLALSMAVPSATRCAIDVALYDWMGKRTGMPLFALWGLNRRSIPTTSVTVGINPPDIVEARTIEVLERTNAKVLKVKL
jgi:L-Ala-D/L-Glu epimerase